jgi:GMP synthase (glutamine-hydrolysing)
MHMDEQSQCSGGTCAPPFVTPRSIVVLDFGGQYAHLIARRVRECGAYSEIHTAETPSALLQDAAGIILSGGPQSVYDNEAPQGDPEIFKLGVPILGICYGLHWMAHTLGGEVTRGHTKEYGETVLRIEDTHWKKEDGIPKEYTVWMSHGDEVSTLPNGFERVATSDACTNAGILDRARHFFGVQFHPEVTHTEYGKEMLSNFVKICNATAWSLEGFQDRIEEDVRNEVGDRNVFMLVSGGVDSTVAFTLLNKVLGSDRVQGLLVDTGLMRKNEVTQIKDAFTKIGISNLYIEDASEDFFSQLKEVYDPEKKRKSIGETFIDVQKRVSEKMNLLVQDGWMLGQGTIYPDRIETGATAHADHIKTHHNRVELIEKMIEKGLVCEPLKDLYKDEVRMLGEEIGLPHDLVWRQPFPGPGLGVRILCATEAFPSEHIDLECPFAYQILPVRSVGVQGDGRTYRHAVSLYAENPCDIGKAQWENATALPNRCEGVNRVLVCTSHSSPQDLIFTPGYLTRERADLLREADAIVDEEMRRSGLYESIWQFPVVLLPLGTTDGGQSVVLRPVESREAMTARAAVLSMDMLTVLTERILSLSGIDLVFYDLTHKPPGTIEWE